MKTLVLAVILVLNLSPAGGWAGVLSAASSGAIRNQALKLQEEGKYKEARELYEDLLKDPGLTGEHLEQVRSQYESLNLKILFSRIETPDSFLYVVQPGDALYTIARKHKTTVELIQKTNALTGDTIYPGMTLKLIKGVFSATVDKSENFLLLKLDDRPVKHYRVATGENNNTPTGVFTVTTKLKNPTWYRAGAVVPPESPENILGTRWMGFDYAGYGIHGTTLPESIGTQSTAGCIRMLNAEVEELYTLIPRGTRVTITD